MFWTKKGDKQLAIEALLDAIKKTDVVLLSHNANYNSDIREELLRQRRVLVDRICTTEAGEVLHRIIRDEVRR